MTEPHEQAPETDYPRPSLTADVVVVAPGGPWGLRVLLVVRGGEPFKGMWALPGGFVEPTETVGEAAARELAEETSLNGVALEELGCFSRPGRDPRGWVVTIAHLATVPAERIGDVRAGDDAASATWLDLRILAGGRGYELAHDGVPVVALAFDHAEILARAVQRIAERTNAHAGVA
jgi:8-oxo-dGTP diphosphatase